MLKKRLAAIIAGVMIFSTGSLAFASQNVEEIQNDDIRIEQRVNPKGWVKTGSQYNYISAQGQKVTGWNKIDSFWYHFDNSGTMLRGWQEIDGNWYYLHAGGAMQIGWLNLGGNWYYFHAGGSMAKGEMNIGGKKYFFKDNGVMATGTFTMNGKTYVCTPSGEFVGSGKQLISNASAYTGHSITSTGQRPYWGSIAVDPRVIPYGSKVYIPYYNKVFVANDCGGAIKGTKIDIFMKSARNMNNFGRRNIPIVVLDK